MRYDVNVTREGRWWMVEIPALDGLTQARTRNEVEEQARSYIAVVLDIPLDEVQLGTISGVADEAPGRPGGPDGDVGGPS